jgi:glycosyltransferase involved in cell wall biosynthesis
MNLGFILEYSLGHITHAQNLKRTLAENKAITPTYIDLPYHNTPGLWAKLPGIRSNWSVRASLGAYLALRPCAGKLQAAFFHTQVTSLFSTGLMKRLPSVVSLDATPIQYDAMGAFYGHVPSGNARLEAIKKRMNQNAYKSARHLITWSEWAKLSLVNDYGIEAGKITVIPPGIDTAQWNFPVRPGNVKGQPVKALFVGGDFPRKGGDILLQAYQQLPASANVELNIVTQTEGVGTGINGVEVHYGVKPNSEKLRSLFAEADLFVFPTRGDCLPLAVMEALSSGKPVISTDVGALSEAVTNGETGLIVPMDNAKVLSEAMLTLAQDDDLRRRMGMQAREVALERFSAVKNYNRVVEIVQGIAAK